MSVQLRNLQVEAVSVAALQPYSRNARRHSKRQIGQIADSMKAFGWMNPILVDANKVVIAGHGRLEAARLLGLEKIPAISVEDLSEDQIRAFRLADNKLAENAEWDADLLRVEFDALIEADLDFEITDTGFSMGEIDLVLGEEEENQGDEFVDEDFDGPPVARLGDVFELGEHRLVCGDALKAEPYAKLMQGEKAAFCFTDPPYNVKIAGNVSGLGRKTHAEFAMGSGEMDRKQFTAFLHDAFSQIAANCVDGAVVDICMDWRHLVETITAGEAAFGELLNDCVWAKNNAGMGSLYRSAHEHVLVFKSGKGKHINNVELGQYGRNRSNVWKYGGVNAFGKGRAAALSMHPTVKPTALVADAILDCSKRRDLVLDSFAGSGTILIAAHRTGRRARAIELDPAYVDVSLRRFRRVTGMDPVHAETGKSLTGLEAELASSVVSSAGRQAAS